MDNFGKHGKISDYFDQSRNRKRGKIIEFVKNGIAL